MYKLKIKVRQVKRIRFNSLRDTIGCNLGVCCDTDTLVTRKCRVVVGECGLKWQLVKDDEYKFHYCNETDQECLDNHELNDVEVVSSPIIKYSWNAQRGVALNKNYSLFTF